MKVLKFSPSRILMLLLVVLFSAFNLSYAQLNNAKSKAEKQKFSWKLVTGKILDEEGRPLSYAGIFIRQSPLGFGVITKSDGTFSMVLPENSTICVNYVGFKTATIKPDYDKNMIIKLKTERLGIDPIVIYPPDYFENDKTLSSIINEERDIGQTKKPEVQAIKEEQNETSNILLVEKNVTINLHKALIIKNDTICSDLKLEDVDPTGIWSIRLLDKEEAIKKYGAIAENGVIVISSEIEIYQNVEEMPEFPGGVTNLRKTLKTNIAFPKTALKKGIEGMVRASFVVDESGFAINVKIEKSIGPLLNNEVLQAIKSLPRWKPAKQRGVPVKITYALPIIFKIPSDYQYGRTEKLQMK